MENSGSFRSLKIKPGKGNYDLNLKYYLELLRIRLSFDILKTKEMRKILSVSIIVFLLFACASEKVNFSQLQDRSGLYFLVNSDKPFTGEVISYLNGKVEFEGKIEKGLREAIWTYYYFNGQKQMEGNYREGVKDGSWTYWKDNGSPAGNELYKFGKLLSKEGIVPGDEKTDTTRVVTNAAPAVAVVKTTPVPSAPASAKKVEKKEEPVIWERLHGGPVKSLDGLPYSGPVVKYQKSGLKEFDGYMSRGKKSGKWIYYDKRGDIKNVRYY